MRSWLSSSKPLRALGCALVLGACSSGGAQPIESTTSICVAIPFETPTCPRRIIPSENLLRDCTEIKVRTVVMDFAAAYSSPTGDPLQFIADESAFKWYSDDLRNGGSLPLGFRGETMLDPLDRGTLGAYLSWQRQTRPTMTIDLLKFYGVRGSDATANFGLELTWGEHRHLGKGAVDCYQLKIMVFSIGPPLPT